jgi:SAM-dependent methyltransferase
VTLTEAETLINCDRLNTSAAQSWFDLGCGSGLFSEALIGLLPAASLIYAIDKEVTSFHHKQIKFLQLDFIRDPLPGVLVDGILMANALHYVKDKIQFLGKIKKHLRPDGVFLLVEYDMETPNQWVPYPLNLLSAQDIFKQAGLEFVCKINERLSSFNNRKIYSALFQNKI